MADEQERRRRLLAELEALPDEAMVPALVRSGLRPPAHLLDRVAEYVAERGFDPESIERITGRLVGLEWEGETLASGALIPSAARHYLDHVVVQQEWPPGTGFSDYLEDARRVVRGRETAIMVSRMHERRRLSFLARLERPVGHAGSNWVVVEYDVSRGHWWSVHRLWRGPAEVAEDKRRDGIIWLRPLT